MPDKLKKTINVLVGFNDGEQPPAAKFTAISSQLQRASEKLEQAIGDLHDESWPYSSLSQNRLSIPWGRDRTTGAALGGSEGRPLGIANLARLIGSAANLNPKLVDDLSSITESYGAGVHEFSLVWPPDDATLVTFADTDPTVFVTYVGEAELAVDGDYHVTDTGKVFCFKATGGGDVTYSATSTLFNGGLNYAGARFNVIPDPNQIQTGAYATTIGALDGNGKRVVTLPLINAQQSNYTLTDVDLVSSDYNSEMQAKLPLQLCNSFTAGEIIPTGFLYLRNQTTNEVYDRATYEYINETTFYISNVDLVDAISAGNLFQVCTVGTDITSSIDDLRNKIYHNHNRQHGEPFVRVEGLSGILRQPGISGCYVPSEMPGNHFPQYLHRDGYRSTYDEANGNDSNAMRGNLFMGLASQTPGNFTSTTVGTGQSYKIQFGTSLAYIQKDGDDNLVFETPVSTDKFLFANGYLSSEGGYSGDVGTHDNAVKFYYKKFTVSGTNIAAGYSYSLPDLASVDVVGFSISIGFPFGSDEWYPPGYGVPATDDNSYKAFVGTDGVNPTIDIEGNAGFSGGVNDVANLHTVRVVIMYRDVA